MILKSRISNVKELCKKKGQNIDTCNNEELSIKTQYKKKETDSSLPKLKSMAQKVALEVNITEHIGCISPTIPHLLPDKVLVIKLEKYDLNIESDNESYYGEDETGIDST